MSHVHTLHATVLSDFLPLLLITIIADTVFRMPFVSRLWNMRQAVQRGYEALYTLQVHYH